MKIGKVHWRVYAALRRVLPDDMADACFVRLLNTALHPSLLCDLDFDCWVKWESQRQASAINEQGRPS